MKKLSKIMLSVAAATALAATMAISAMAEDTIEATYDSETGKVTITEGTITSTGASQTLLVLTTDDYEEVTSSIIAQIDQKDDGTSFEEFMLPAGLEEGTYYIKVGGDGEVQTGTLTITSSEPPIETITITFGNANFDSKNKVNAGDAKAVAQYLGGKDVTNKEMFGKTYSIVTVPEGIEAPETWVFGNFNFDNKNKVNAGDAKAIAQYLGGKDVTNKALFGQTIEIAEVK